jgi:glucose/arabinose dehydrogenase
MVKKVQILKTPGCSSCRQATKPVKKIKEQEKLKEKIRFFKGVVLMAAVLIVLGFLVFKQFGNPILLRAENITAEIVAKNLIVPWSIDFLPDGKIIFTERVGRINVIDRGVVNVAEIDVATEGEAGLLGIEVDPDFDENGFLYVYHTYYKEGNLFNKIVRFKMMGFELVNETVILDKIPGARFHNGGRLKFGPDGKLYITTGDALDPMLAQDVNSLAGKILRINRDGSIPEDNPFGNEIYSYGHRNPQGLAWHPVTGGLYSTEHGPVRNDEINIIIKGKNYGWPIVECESQEYQRPIRCYKNFTLAPSGIFFYNGDLYIAGLRGKQLRKIRFGKDYKTILEEEEIITDLGRIRDVVGRGSYLYVATNNRDGRGIPRPGDDKIIKISLID